MITAQRQRRQKNTEAPSAHVQLAQIKSLQKIQLKLAEDQLAPLRMLSHLCRYYLFGKIAFYTTPEFLKIQLQNFFEHIVPYFEDIRTSEFIQLIAELKNQVQAEIAKSDLLQAEWHKRLTAHPLAINPELMLLADYLPQFRLNYSELMDKIASAVATVIQEMNPSFIEQLEPFLLLSANTRSAKDSIKKSIILLSKTDYICDVLSKSYPSYLLSANILLNGTTLIASLATSGLSNRLITKFQTKIDRNDYSRMQLKYDEADKIIEVLTETNNEWRYTAARNKIIAYSILCIGYAYLISAEGVEKIIASLLLYALSIVINGRAEVRSLYDHCRYPLAYKEKHLNSVLNNCSQAAVELYKESSDATSFFVIRVHDYLEIKASEVCQAIKQVFCRNRFNFSFEGERTLIIQGDLRIHADLAQSMNKQLLQALARLSSGKKLIQQIKQIALKLNTKFTCIPTHNQDGLTSYKFFLFNLPEHGLRLFTNDEFAGLFAKAQLINQKKELILEQDSEISEAAFQKLIAALATIQSSQLKALQQKTKSSTTATVKGRLGKIPHGLAPPASLEENKNASNLEEVKADQRPIIWSTGSYDPIHPPTIPEDIDLPMPPLPLKSSRIPSGKLMLFTQLLVTKDDLPTVRQYKAFRELAIRSNVAAAHGEQGFRFLRQPTQQVDTDGQSFSAVIDLKGLGENKNIRLYGEEERAVNGQELLFKIKGVDLHKH